MPTSLRAVIVGATAATVGIIVLLTVLLPDAPVQPTASRDTADGKSPSVTEPEWIRLARALPVDTLWDRLLPPLMRVRVPDSPGSTAARKVRSSLLS
jgi:hypothetical protein